MSREESLARVVVTERAYCTRLVVGDDWNGNYNDACCWHGGEGVKNLCKQRRVMMKPRDIEERAVTITVKTGVTAIKKKIIVCSRRAAGNCS
mmetsp:Transcript_22933/g.49613  ORF Transcript_22933/g.49613 Transcript_22933/m.49613 type:complete len:92 (-) Transcript_22933:827-1102(-)